MITDELLDFLRTQHAAGMKQDEMIRLLTEEGGWNIADINEGFRAAGLPQLIADGQKGAQAPEKRISPKPVMEDLTSVASATPAEIQQMIAPSEAPKEPVVAPAQPIIQEHVIAPSALPDLSGLAAEKIEEGPEIDISLPDVNIDEVQKGTLSVEGPANAAQTNGQAATSSGVHFDLSHLEGVSKPVEETVAPISTSEEVRPQPAAVTTGPSGAVHVEIEGENGAKKIYSDDPSKKQVETKPLTEKAETKTEHPKRAYPPLQKTRTMSSDLLLRGKGPQLSATPAIAAPEMKPVVSPAPVTEQLSSTLPSQTEVMLSREPEVRQPIEKPAPSPKPSPAPIRTPAPAPAAPAARPVLPASTPPVGKPRPKRVNDEMLFEEAKGDRVKKILVVALWCFIALVVGGGAAFAYIALKGPDMSRTFTDGFAQFFAAPSFSYQGKSSADLELSTANEGTEQNGSIVYDVGFSGRLLNSIEGFGNGEHHVKFSGKLMTGDFSWGTDVESDVKLVGTSLYFHVLSYPDQADLDPDTMKIYWIKIDLSEIADSLGLSGVTAAENGYGTFGGASIDNTFDSLLLKYKPFVPDKKLNDEAVNGIPATHMSIKADPSNATQFVIALYRKYTSKDLTLSDDQRLRLERAFGKWKGELWVDPKTKHILKITLAADLDDDMIGVHVKGPFTFSTTFSDYNKQFSVDEPSPSLTLDELKTRLEDYKKVKDLRDADKAKADTAEVLVGELEKYKAQKGKYPSSLLDLYYQGGLATSSVSKDDIKQYFYAAYVKKDSLTRTSKCTASSKVCGFYHLGVDFDDVNDPLLGTDADLTSSEIRGGDSRGCANVANLACYDLVSAPLPPEDTATSTPSSASSTQKK